MRVVLIFLAVLGVAYGTGSDAEQFFVSKDLNDDVQDFMALIPTDLIIEHTLSYLEDPEFQTVLYFLFSEDFAEILRSLLAVPEVIEYAQFLRDHGLHLDRYIEWVREFFGSSRGRVRIDNASLGGLTGWINGVIELLPIDDIRALAVEKVDTSESFRTIYEALQSEEFQDVIRRLRANDNYQTIVASLVSFGVDVQRIGQIFVGIFGWDL